MWDQVARFTPVRPLVQPWPSVGRPSNPPEMSQWRALSPVEEGLGFPSRKAVEVAEWDGLGWAGEEGRGCIPAVAPEPMQG